MGGLDAPTRSTVNLTLTATASGSVTAGDAYSDGTHVWTLDGGHSWSGSGSKGPYAATIYSPGSPAYYGPVEAASGTITTILTPNANVSAVTNASDAATGTAHFGGDGSSVAVDSLGGLLFNASGTLLYRFGPSASGGHAYGDIIGPSPAIDEAYKFYRIIADGNGTKFGAAGITSVGTPHPSLWYLTPSNTAAPASNEETLPNASSYTTDAAFVAVSPTAVVFVSVDGSVTSTWTASGFGDVYTEHGTPSPLTGQTCVALEWSPTDSLFVMATHSGNIFTSSGGVVWQNPGTAGLTIQHMAILGGSWLVKGTFAGVDKLAWSGDQGLTWQVVQVPWTGGDVVSLVALKDCFGVLWVGDDGTAKLYRSLVV
jgi:hypothetical protein